MENNGVFNFSYEIWSQTIEMYRGIKQRSLKYYLQWFPFSKLSDYDWDILQSEEFYRNNIVNGAFCHLESQMLVSKNYIQKSDSSFRNATLVSPILYLLLQAVGLDISKKYIDNRCDNISAYYAGNYNKLNPSYKKEYDAFFKEINVLKDECRYFIKTDLKSFYDNIEIDTLIRFINKNLSDNKRNISQDYLFLIKELLSFAGNDKFPLIENSLCSSFLSTIVYLSKIDNELFTFITNFCTITNVHMVRYVDDMYILFNSDKSPSALLEECNEIRNKYSSLLSEIGLSLNSSKFAFNVSSEINEELKKSLYDEFYNGNRHDIGELFKGSLSNFLKEIIDYLSYNTIDVEHYNALISKHFKKEGIEFTESEVYNYFVYGNSKELESLVVQNQLNEIVRKSVSFLSVDSKRLMTLILDSKSSDAIKGTLNTLFSRDRKNIWNRHDTVVAITYLLQSGFKHIDLKDVLERREYNLYCYYEWFCSYSFMNMYYDNEYEKLLKCIGDDYRTFYLYFLYICEMKKDNIVTAFAYYKTYFDRVSADISCALGIETKKGKPSYNTYYKEGNLCKLYSEIAESAPTIKELCRLRQYNPLCHSSGTVLNSDDYDTLLHIMEETELIVSKKVLTIS